MPALPVTIDPAAVSALYQPGGAVYEAVDSVGALVQARAAELCPKGTGALAASITRRNYQNGYQIVCRVYSTLPQAAYLTYGTGIYGPRATPIVPVSAKALRFEPKGGNGFVFAKSVKGTPPNSFFNRAMMEASPWPKIYYRPV